MSPPGEGSDGTDGDAVDGGGGAGDAPRAGVVPERSVGGVPGAPCGAGANPAVRETCGIALSGLRPKIMKMRATGASSLGRGWQAERLGTLTVPAAGLR